MLACAKVLKYFGISGRVFCLYIFNVIVFLKLSLCWVPQWLRIRLHRVWGVEIISIFIYLLTPWSRVLPEKLAVSQLAKKLHTFSGTGRFITALTRGRHMSLFWIRPIQSMASRSHFLKIHFNILQPFILGFPSGLFPSGFPAKIMYATLLSPIRATCPAHLLYLITRVIGE